MLWYIQAFRKYICKWQGLGTIHAICLVKKTASFYLPLLHNQTNQKLLLFYSIFLSPALLHMSSFIRESHLMKPYFFPFLPSNPHNYQTLSFPCFSLLFPFCSKSPYTAPSPTLFSTDFNRKLPYSNKGKKERGAFHKVLFI